MRVKAELRSRAARGARARGPGGVPGFPTARIATLLGPGLDALDEYFGRYLPQLVLDDRRDARCSSSAAWIADPLSGLVLVIVLPLIPVFMALIGMATAAVQRRQWDSLAALSRGFLEVVGGLSTLSRVRPRRAPGRAHPRASPTTTAAGTMKVLRITFLSGFTLEFAASLSVALVAVSIGLRLVAGDLALAPGLFVLVLAPEVFLPLRNVGAAFHASAAGRRPRRPTRSTCSTPRRPAASRPMRRGPSDRAMTPAAGCVRASIAPTAPVATPLVDGLVIDGLDVRRGDRVVLDGFHLVARPGEVVAVTGESGSGKSSLLAALLGFAEPRARDPRRSRTASGRSLVDRLGGAGAGAPRRHVAVERAPRRRGRRPDRARRVRSTSPASSSTPTRLGPGGGGLSGGQAQRVATARAIHRLLRGTPGCSLLDEPSSAQDAAPEAALGARLRELAADGRRRAPDDAPHGPRGRRATVRSSWRPAHA